MTPDLRPFCDWMIALLLTGTGKPVGDHDVPTLPEPPPGQAESPYCIVYSIDGGGFSGPALFAPNADAELMFQVTSAGRTRGQAQWMSDMVRRTVLARSSTGFWVSQANPTGWVVADRRPDGPTPGVDVEGSAPHRVFSVPERFVVCVTPA
jgi:hypothetical protein